MSFFPLEHLMNLYEGYQRAFKVDQLELLLVQSNGKTYLVQNRCPHQQAPLTHARLDNNQLRCAAHGMCFDLETGVTTDGCFQQLTFFPIAYEGNQIGINI